jgi:hypothetical protein
VTGPLRLLSLNENGLTFAFGFALSNVPRLADRLLERLGVRARGTRNTPRVILQERSARDGITDMELRAADDSVLALLEAKASGWPRLSQLSKYARKTGIVPGRTLIVALGVDPARSELVEKTFLAGRGGRVRFQMLRWVDVLSIVHDLRPRSPVLEDLQGLIREVIRMQSYDREVAIRDVRFGGPYHRWFMECNLACTQPSDKTEPLFYAPCFTRAKYRHLDGIHYFGRIYHRGLLVRGQRGNRQTLLEEARAVITSKLARLKSKKTRESERAYLQSLPKKWDRGLRQIASSRGGRSLTVWFLGDPIRLPRPLRKIGRQIPRGFAMPLEWILSSEAGTFRC